MNQKKYENKIFIGKHPNQGFGPYIMNKILQLIFSVSFIYLLGVLWLGTLIGWEKPLFQLGVQPFLLAELFKILIILFSLPKLKKLNQYLK